MKKAKKTEASCQDNPRTLPSMSPAVSVKVEADEAEAARAWLKEMEQEQEAKNLIKVQKLIKQIEAIPLTKPDIQKINQKLTQKEQKIDEENAQARDSFILDFIRGKGHEVHFPAVVLDQIFSRLEVKDLLSCRLVSVDWWHCATLKFRKIQTAGFSSLFDDDDECDKPNSRSAPFEFEELDKYVELMQTSKLQPFNTFYFTGLTSTDVSLLKNFFDVVGPSLVDLTWELMLMITGQQNELDDDMDKPPTIGQLQQVLHGLQLPALTKLDLKISNFENHGLTLTHKRDKTKLLQTFWKAAPNLAHLTFQWDYNSAPLFKFVEQNSLLRHLTSLNLKSSLSLGPHYQCPKLKLDLDLDLFCQFKLRELSFDVHAWLPDQGTKLNNFLQSQSRTLQTLELFACGGSRNDWLFGSQGHVHVSLSQFEFPRMEHLRTLALVCWGMEESLMTATVIDWPAMFPNLEQLELNNGWQTKRDWLATIFAKNSGVHRKLRTLSISGSETFTSHLVKVQNQIARIFPNMEAIKIPYCATTVGLGATDICQLLPKLFKLIFCCGVDGFGNHADTTFANNLEQYNNVFESLEVNLQGLTQVCFEVTKFNQSSGCYETRLAKTLRVKNYLKQLSRKIKLRHASRNLFVNLGVLLDANLEWDQANEILFEERPLTSVPIQAILAFVRAWDIPNQQLIAELQFRISHIEQIRAELREAEAAAAGGSEDSDEDSSSMDSD